MLAAKSDRRLGKGTSLGTLLARLGLRWRVAPIWYGVALGTTPASVGGDGALCGTWWAAAGLRDPSPAQLS